MPATRKTTASRLARHLAVVAGLAILLWSGFEDTDARAAALLGFFAATSATLFLLGRTSWLWPGKSVLPDAALAGTLLGALSAIATAALMLFKNLRHAHIYPDYPTPMLLAMLERVPLWALAGGLAGIGIGLLLTLREEN